MPIPDILDDTPEPAAPTGPPPTWLRWLVLGAIVAYLAAGITYAAMAAADRATTTGPMAIIAVIFQVLVWPLALLFR